jgi:hypothetical protein
MPARKVRLVPPAMRAAARAEAAEKELTLVDRREGTWTKLELIRMDQRFCAAMRRAHPEHEEPQAWVKLARRLA